MAANSKKTAEPNEEASTDATKAERRPGFDDKGQAYPGVDRDTGERVTVTLEGLRKEFGPKSGEEKYRQIAQITGAADSIGKLEQYAPDIQIKGADESLGARIGEILTKE